MNYFDVGYISNSSLGEFKRFMNEEPSLDLIVKQETLDFGSLFHTACLEPHLYTEGDNKIVENMRDALNRNVSYRYLRFHPSAKLEHEQYRKCKITGVHVKMKIDLQVFSSQGDIKSTACTSAAAFFDSCNKYDYNRQAAFYMDHGKGETFTFYGVQKKHPYNVFTRIYQKNDKDIRDGRDEYLWLINKAKSIGLL